MIIEVASVNNGQPTEPISKSCLKTNSISHKELTFITKTKTCKKKSQNLILEVLTAACFDSNASQQEKDKKYRIKQKHMIDHNKKGIRP